MSDEIPAWAEALEHAIVREVGKAIADSEARVLAEMTRRFDEVRDDLTVNLAAANSATDRVKRLDDDFHELRKAQAMMLRRLRELEQWRSSRPEAGQ